MRKAFDGFSKTFIPLSLSEDNRYRCTVSDFLCIAEEVARVQQYRRITMSLPIRVEKGQTVNNSASHPWDSEQSKRYSKVVEEQARRLLNLYLDMGGGDLRPD